MSEEKESFKELGKEFQESLVQLIFEDRPFADQIIEVLDYDFFELKHHQEFIKKVYLYKNRYGNHPSKEIFGSFLKTEMAGDDLISTQVRNLHELFKTKALEDVLFIKDKSIEFCKRQKIKEAIFRSIELIPNKEYDNIEKIIKEAVNLGYEDVEGHNYHLDIEERYADDYRHNVIPTGWDPMNIVMNGGLGGGETGIFIAPTGCHAKGTKVVRYDGELVKVEDVKVGDQLMGPDSNPRTVQYLCRGSQQMYEIIPIKGKPFTVNEDHILSLKDNDEKITNITVKDYLSKSEDFKTINSLWRPKQVHIKDNTLFPKNTLTGFKVWKTEVDDYYGFNLDGDHLYLLEDFIVTHNTGKSFFLSHLGMSAVKAGFNVVHFIMELNESKIGRRYDSLLTTIPLDELTYNRQRIKESVDKITGNLEIIKFLPNRITMNTLMNRIEKIKKRPKNAFKPNLIIVDYGDLINPMGNFASKVDGLQSVFNDLQLMAEEYNVPVWSATQTNRCLIKSTRLFIKRKNVKRCIEISEIRIGDEVETHLGWRSVTHKFNSKEKVVKILLKNGKNVICSKKHVFPTFENKLLSIETGLCVGSKLLIRKNKNFKFSNKFNDLNLEDFDFSEIVSIEEYGEEETIDITVQDAHMFFLENDIYTHNSGFRSEIIELDQVADAYAKCFRANFIATISRRPEDIANQTGRIFIAKNNLGRDKIVYPIFMDTFGVSKIELLPELKYDELIEPNAQSQQSSLKEKFEAFKKRKY